MVVNYNNEVIGFNLSSRQFIILSLPKNKEKKKLVLKFFISPFSHRLLAHSEDPDIDEPYKPPVGHVLGDSKCVNHLNTVMHWHVPFHCFQYTQSTKSVK